VAGGYGLAAPIHAVHDGLQIAGIRRRDPDASDVLPVIAANATIPGIDFFPDDLPELL
jgi:hypothetical protein